MARRALNKLTAIAVDRAKKPGRHSDGGGLYLLVKASGSKSWVFMYSRRGRKGRTELGIGPYPAISLLQAREKAVHYRSLLAEGGDPESERAREPGRTFGQCAEAFIERHQSEWRNEKHRHQWRQTLKTYCAAINEKPIADIGTEDILSVLQPIWTIKAETASRVRGRMERIIDYAKARGWRDGENPARWRGHLSSILPKARKLVRGHMASMDYQDIPDFVSRLQASSAMAARALEVLILTATRSGEILNVPWAEIDLESALWTIPADRMKAGREHRVPLTDRVVEILADLDETRQSEYVFPGQKRGRPLSNMAMEMLLRRMKFNDITVHGFRSSFRDWCGDQTSFPREIAEAALAHQVGNRVEMAYRRKDALEKRRQLMEAWERYCLGADGDNVISIGGGGGR